MITSPHSSDSEDEVNRKHNVCGIYWECGPPFVILPGESRKTAYLLSRTSQTQSAIKSPPVLYIFTKLSFKQSLKNPRRFNYITNMLELVLKQNLIGISGSSQKKLLLLLEQLVNTVLATEHNVHIAKALVTLYKEKHLTNKALFKRPKLWSSILNRISSMERKLYKFRIRKICREKTDHQQMHILDMPVDVLRLIFRCFSDHRDLGNLALVNRYFFKLSKETSVWKSLCLYHLSPSKLSDVDPNIPISWKSTYQKYVKRFSMKQAYAELLIICSDCHFVCWKGTHLCRKVIPVKKDGSRKPAIAIPVTPTGFCHLFER